MIKYWFKYKYPLHTMIADAILVAKGESFLIYHPERNEKEIGEISLLEFYKDFLSKMEEL